MEIADVEQLLFFTMEYSVIQRLMSGNDTQCFTTSQYAVARDKWIAEQCGATRESLGMEGPSVEIVRKQLRAFPLVVEVSPDTWTLRELIPPTAGQSGGE